MAYKLRYNKEALTDLRHVLDWSLENHPNQTEDFAGDLFRRLDLLTEFPCLGSPVGSSSKVRQLLHPPLFVYYRVDEAKQAVVILYVRHRSRRQPKFQ